MAAIYDKFGIHFLYPENWSLSEDQPEAGAPSVSVVSPGGGFWSVSMYSSSADCEALLAEVVSTMRQEYEGLETEEVTEQIGQFEALGCNMDFYCLDLIVTARARSIPVRNDTLLVLYQAELHDFDELERVFQAITLSLVQGKSRIFE